MDSLQPGAQYVGHHRAVLSMAFVRDEPLTVASVDASGALHFWDATCGKCLAIFADSIATVGVLHGCATSECFLG